jgi:ATP-dependent DNA helicase RecG
MSVDLDSPIQFLKGVGPARAKVFEKLGILSVGDLLEYYPFRYDLIEAVRPIEALEPDAPATTEGVIASLNANGHGRGFSISGTLEDGTGRCGLRWFNASYLRGKLARGMEVRVHGRVAEYNDHAQFVNPQIEFLHEDQPGQARDRPELVGVYPATKDLSSRRIRDLAIRALTMATLPDEFLPADLLRARKWMRREKAIETLHRPGDLDQVQSARSRLAYDELLLMQLAVGLKRQHLVSHKRAQRYEITDRIAQRIRGRFPFKLTVGQEGVIGPITADLNRDRPMNRLLQGDVGSGKTAVAMYAALGVIAGGGQVAIMAPTEILAEQHASKVGQYLEGSRVQTALLVGGQTQAARTRLRKDIAGGRIDLIVGTQALLEEGVEFQSLGLVVVDEQHKFGVIQRATIRSKGLSPHYLVMTATPIPRTMAMTVFGDLDCSVIDGLPPGRQPITTTLYRGQRNRKAWELARSRLAAGEQVYVVYPLLEASEKLPLRAARSEVNHLAKDVFPEHVVDLVHGQMPSEEKAAAMDRFRSGRTRVLVATTVVEVGIDVPNATVMIVEHAERFGLSQLHQLRGRVGRGSRTSHCLLLTTTRNSDSLARLRVLCETNDGFKVAEEDLRIRGPGEVMGTRQHGLPTFRLANLVTDIDLLMQARTDAGRILAKDEALRQRQHQPLRRALLAKYRDTLALVDVA